MEIKKIIKSKNVWSIFLVFTMLILLSSFVSANFGVGSPVSELLYPGQSIESALSVQNTLDDAKDLIVAGEILEGGDYVSFINDVSNIMVPAGEIVVVPIKISVPQDAKIGDIYDIKVLFKGISGGSGGEGGTIEFKFNVGKSFKVVVIEKPQPPAEKPVTPTPSKFVIGTGWIILVILVIIAIVAVILLKAKKKRR